MTTHDDGKWTRRALELARQGAGWVSPNPLVGCVIVSGGEVIGEGFHERHGQAHAEVNAIADARSNGRADQLNGSTMYVTLEPCVHHGHTPPCVDAVLECGIKRVVFAVNDPDPRVAGRGESLLREKRVIVEKSVGALLYDALYLNRIFFHWVRTGRPYVCVKVAVSRDDRIARKAGERTQISDAPSVQFAHELRQLFDAILVGVETVLSDDPALTVRYGVVEKRRDPLRVVLDSTLRIPQDAKVLNDINCMIATTAAADNEKKEALADRAEVVEFPATSDGKVDLDVLLRELAVRRVTSVLIEGGQRVLSSFTDHGLVDEWVIIRSPETFGEGPAFVADLQQWKAHYALFNAVTSGKDVIEYYRPVQRR